MRAPMAQNAREAEAASSEEREARRLGSDVGVGLRSNGEGVGSEVIGVEVEGETRVGAGQEGVGDVGIVVRKANAGTGLHRDGLRGAAVKDVLIVL